MRCSGPAFNSMGWIPPSIGLEVLPTPWWLKALVRAERNCLPIALELSSMSRVERDLFEASALMHEELVRRWKPSRHRAVRMMRGHSTQREAAAALGITPQSISDALSAGHFEALRLTEDALRALLVRQSHST